MNLLNHYLDIGISEGVTIPNRLAASTTNGVPSILADASGCAPFNAGRNPNFLLLDWVDDGAAFQAADLLNGLTS